MPRLRDLTPFILIFLYFLLNSQAAHVTPLQRSTQKQYLIDRDCPPNHIKCPESNQCILIAQLCDGIKQCRNGSDEGGFCSEANQACQSSHCKYGCKRSSTTGLLCYCPEGKFYNSTDCEDVDLSLPLLIYSTKTPSAIKVVSSEEFPHLVLPPLYVPSPVVAFTTQSSNLYFADQSRNTIFEFDIFNQSSLRPFRNKGVSHVAGLASDEFNLYWTDSLLGTINAAPLESPSTHKILVNKPGSKPTELVVSSRLRTMIWLDQKATRPKFHQCLLDGTSGIVLPIELKNPKGLTLDSNESSILWWDQGVCYKFNLATQQLTQVLERKQTSVPRITNLVSFDETLTWSQGSDLYRTTLQQKEARKVSSVFLDAKPNLLIKFANNSVGKVSQNTCDHLYLPLPFDNFECACKEGFRPHPVSKNLCLEIKPCGPKEYQCGDGTCISENYVCDGEQDCPLISEELTCDTACPKDKFRCKSGQCIPTSWKCDGRPDCLDGSDEEECDFCLFPGHSCDNGLLCLNASHICDGVSNCEDGSDEPVNCTKLQAECDCEDTCHLVGNETVCGCHPGRILAANGRNCSNHSVCNNYGTCSHFCTPHASNASHFTCSCAKGYYLAADKFSCLSKDQQSATLIYSTGSNLNLYNLTNKKSHSMAGKSYDRIVHFAFEYETPNGTMVYWSDRGQKKIFRSLQFDGLHEVVIDTGLEAVEGLAVDWVQHRLYWLDTSLKHIETADINGHFRTRVVSQLGKPRSLAVDSIARYLFWADWEKGRARIERSHLSGQKRQVIVDLSEVGGIPNGINLDITTRRLFWVDAALGTIHVADYDGLNQRVIRSTEHYLKPFSIASFNNDIFFTDWQHNVLAKTSQWNKSSEIQILAVNYPHIYDVNVVHSSQQPKASTKNPCALQNGGCSHMCFSTPSDDVTCGCPYGLVLSSDQTSCTESPALLSYLTSNNLLVLGTNKEQMFPSVGVKKSVNPLMVDNGYFYWAQDSSVYRHHVLEQEDQVLLTQVGFHPVAIAPGPHSLLYIFGKVEEGKGYLAVSKKSGELLAPLVWEDLNEPLALTVDQASGNVFWAHEKVRPGMPSQYIIEMSRHDGTRRKTLISSDTDSQMGRPSHLTVVPAKKNLCWLNANQTIWCMDYINTVPLRNLLQGAKGLCALNSTTLAWQDSGSVYQFNPHLKHTSTKLLSSNSVFNLVPTFNSLNSDKDSLPCPSTCICVSSNKCLNDKNDMIIYLESGSPKTLRSSHLLPSFVDSSAVQYITHDPLTNYIFWSDSNNTVSRVRLDGQHRKVLFNSTERVRGLAVDWIGDNLFWISGSQIQVSRSDGLLSYILLRSNEKMFSLKLHPSKGLMFWISNGLMIKRATLAGQDVRTIVTSATPIADLSVDQWSDTLYWSSPVAGHIETAQLDGSGQTTLVAGLDHPHSLAVNSQALFWSDNSFVKNGAIFTSSKTGTNQTLVQDKLGKHVHSISVLDSSLPEVRDNPCGLDNGGCSHLCLYEGVGSRRMCTCANSHLASDQSSCTRSSTYLLLGSKDEVSSFNLLNPFDPNPPLQPFHIPGHTILAFALDQSNHILYFSSFQGPFLFQLNLLDAQVHPLLSTSDFTPRKIEGLAFNALDNDLYWVDSAYPSIWRLQLSPAVKKPELVIKLDPYDQPRSITLDTCSMRMFWSDWRTDGARIETAYLSGTQRQILVKDGLTQPNGITYNDGHLYWVDVDNNKHYSVGRVSVLGGRPQVMFEGDRAIPFSIVVHQSSIFWTDWKSNSLLVNDMLGNVSQSQVVATTKNRPMGLVAFDPFFSSSCKSSPTSTLECPSSCNSGVCVPSSGMSPPQCLCPMNYTGAQCEIALFVDQVPLDQVLFALTVACCALLAMVALIILYIYKKFCFTNKVLNKVKSHFPNLFSVSKKIVKDPKPKTCVEYYNLSNTACEEQSGAEEDCCSPKILCNHTIL